MTNKDNLQKELKAKVKPGIKPSHLRKSKSLSDIPTTPPLPPLQKSKSQLEIPIANQPTPQQQIAQLQETVKFHAQTSQNYLQNLQLAQAKITELEEELQAKESFVDAPEENPFELKEKITNLEDQILQLRLEKITEFGYFLEKKQELKTELELNISEGVAEIHRLENKLIATNKKKLELQQQLGQELSKNAQLELNSPANSNHSNHLKYSLYSLCAVLFTLWLVNNLKTKNYQP